MKLKICLMALLCLFFQAATHAQTGHGYLRVGDKMPDLEIKNIMNWNRKSARISDFKGKLLILDFWNTYCASCIAGFPRLDSLQHDFKGKLQVILVNPDKGKYETLNGVKMVIDRMITWSDRPFVLPVAFKDNIIHKNFDYYSAPFIVLIGPDGTIISIPKDKKELTDAVIAKAIAGEKIDVEQYVSKRVVPAGKAAL